MDALFTSLSPVEQVNKTCVATWHQARRALAGGADQHSDAAIFPQGELVKSYAVSTSRRPPSNVKNSLGTPRGLHEIAERIGAGQPPGMVFKSRVPTGRHFSEVLEREPNNDNLITSRILWLRGLGTGREPRRRGRHL